MEKNTQIAKNKLAWLGYLGFVGILGLWIGSPVFMVFLLFFFFFSFTNMPLDELFWQHVHKAGLRALVTYFTLTILSFFFIMFITAANGFGMEQFDNPTREFAAHLMLEVALSTVIFMITLCVFMFTLMYFIHKEKKGLDIPEVDTHVENQA